MTIPLLQQLQKAPSAFIHPLAYLIGNIQIGEDASIWPFCSIRGDLEPIHIGDRTNIQDGTVLHTSSNKNPSGVAAPLFIGSDVTVGHAAMLHGCTIHPRVLVGMRATVLDNAVIESDVILAAGALVPPGKHLKSGFIYAGSPAKPLRALSEKELAFLTESVQNYVQLKNQYLTHIYPNNETL